MKKIFTSLFIATLALATAVSCDKGNDTETATEGKALTINFIADDDIALSRTELDSTGKKAAWVEGDKIAMPYYNTEKSTWSIASNTIELADGKASFEFTTYGPSSKADNNIFFVYPCLSSRNYGYEGIFRPFNIAATQTPTLTSFDGTADFLVGQPVAVKYTGTWSSGMTFSVKFIRKSALMRLHFAGLDELVAEEVKSVTVTAQEGAVLAGDNFGVKADLAIDGQTADPYSIVSIKDDEYVSNTTTANAITADYSAKNITVADLQTTEAGKGVWLSMLPAEINSLKVTIELKNGAKVEFAERATAGMAVKENEITPITLTFDKAKGDKASVKVLATQVLTITNTADGLAGAVTDAEGNPVEINAVEEYGLTTTLGTGTYFWISSSSSSAYIRNTKAIGDYITKLTIKGSGSNDGYKYTTGTAAITSNSGSNSTGTTTKSFTAADGIKYFNVSKHNSKTGKITSIVIEYTVSTTTEL